MVTHLTLTFSGVVTIGGDAFRLSATTAGRGRGRLIAGRRRPDDRDPDLRRERASWRGSLADGRYTLTVLADRIHDATGQALDGDGDGSPGGDYVDHLFRLFGDADGDGDVDNKDYFVLPRDGRQERRRHRLPLVPGLRRRRDRRPRHRLRGVQGPEPQDARVRPPDSREPGTAVRDAGAVPFLRPEYPTSSTPGDLIAWFLSSESSSAGPWPRPRVRPRRRPARAGSAYQFAFDQSTYQVDPGGQVLVNVYLQEQVSGGTSSVLATDGLIGAGMRVSFDLAPLPSDPAKVLGVGDVIPNDGPGGFRRVPERRPDAGLVC